MENINKYIEQKYIDFKFPLLKAVEEEVKVIKNKIASRGAIGGPLVSEPYKIRKNYIEKLFFERVSLEINTRKEFGININDDEYNNIVQKILNLIEHEYNLWGYPLDSSKRYIYCFVCVFFHTSILHLVYTGVKRIPPIIFYSPV